MPYDLEAVERGYGECVATFGGAEITLRYRADLDGRALIALKRAFAGVPIIGRADFRIPDTELVISELTRLLLPCSDAIPEDERGWDVTRAGHAVEITPDELMALPAGLPVALLGAILADVYDPNRRKLSLNGSRARADSPPTASPTTTGSSPTPNGPASLRGSSPAIPPTLEPGPAGGSGSEP
jgi:hypothetical protein